MNLRTSDVLSVSSVLLAFAVSSCSNAPAPSPQKASSAATVLSGENEDQSEIFGNVQLSAKNLVRDGRHTFRFDTFGDETFWGGQLQLQRAVSTLSPRQALALGLKVDISALSEEQREAVRRGGFKLDDPSATIALLERNAVLGLQGFFGAAGSLDSIGITCAFCHSTVDDSVVHGIGRRIDGLANRDLNVGAVIASAPNLQPLIDTLKVVNPRVDREAVTAVLKSWGPGKFDAEVFLDGKAFQPDGTSAATLIPNARGLGGFNLHTWTGGWGSIPYWNALVAVLEMHGTGTFFDERLDDKAQFPIAAALGLGHISVSADDDRVTKNLPALQFYQLALAAPKPRAGIDFDPAAAKRGDDLFSGKAACNNCHREPLWTEPGWNQHTAAEMKIDSFESDRSPGHAYKTMNLAGIFVRERGLFMASENQGRFYHDGRFHTLRDVVDSYDARFSLGLSDAEKSDLIEYLKSL